MIFDEHVFLGGGVRQFCISPTILDEMRQSEYLTHFVVVFHYMDTKIVSFNIVR